MRLRLKYANAKGPSGSVLVCVALICGAIFGMLAQAGLLHIGLDFGSVRDNLIVGAAARPRSALAWWAWWLLPLGAFLVGPLSVALTRWLADWWLFRAARPVAFVAGALALAAAGDLPAASSTLDVRLGAAASLAVVVLSALLAWLGARVLGSFGRETEHARTFTRPLGRAPARSPEQIGFRISSPIPAAPPRHGGGSAAAGAPFLRVHQRHALVSRFTIGHLALVAMLVIAVSAAVVGVSGVTVLVVHATPGAVRQFAAWSGLRASGPPRTGRAVGMAADAPPAPAAQAEPQGMVIDGVLVPESELTFAEGYRKRQAVLAAKRASVKIVAAAEKAEAKLPIQLKNVAALPPVPYGHIRRHATILRHIARHVGPDHRVHKKYTRVRRPASRYPYRAHDHRRERGHYHYARYPRYRLAWF